VHSFPINVEIEDVSGSTVTHEVWNRRDSNILLQMQIVEEDDSKINDVVGYLTTYWYLFTLLAIISLSGIVLFIIRRKNAIDFDALDENVDDDILHSDEWEDIVDEAAAWDENMSDEIESKNQPRPPDAVARDIRGKPKPPGAVQRDIARQRRQTVPSGVKQQHRVRRTKKTEPSPTPQSDSVEFKQLLSSTNNTESSNQDDDDDDDDDEISDAIAFITSESPDKSKRKRPVRRKKKKD